MRADVHVEMYANIMLDLFPQLTLPFLHAQVNGYGWAILLRVVGGVSSGGVYCAVNEDCLCGEKCPHCGCGTSSF